MKIFLLLTLMFTSLSAQEKVIDLNIDKKIVIPSPGKLAPNWWGYFEKENYEAHSKAFIEELSEVQAELSLEQKEETNSLVKKILVNMEALPKFRNQEIEPPPEHPFLDSYSLDQQLELAASLRQLQTQLKADNKELLASKASVVKFRGHIDDLTSLYLKMDKKTFPKFNAGLELIAFRFALEVTEEKLRNLDDRVDIVQDQVSHLRQEVTYATKHLDMGSINIADLNTKLAEYKKLLSDKKQRTLQSELGLVGVLGDSPIERSRLELLTLQAMRAKVEESVARSDMLITQFKIDFYEAFSSFEELNHDEFRIRLSENSASLDEIEDKVKEYQRELDQGLDKLGAPAPNDEGLSKQDLKIEELRKERYNIIQEMVPEVEKLRSKISITSLIEKNTYALVRSKRSSIENWWTSFYSYFTGCCSTALAWMHKSLFKIGGVPVTSYDIFSGLMVLVGAYVFSLIVRTALSRFAKRHKRISNSSVFIVNRILHYIILLLGVFIALTVIGLDLNSVFLFLGALSVGIGFGLQSIVNNFVCSLILIFTRNIKVGDYIKLSTGEWGSVSAVNVQNTIIRDWDGVDIVVPNSALVANRFDNWTRKDPYKRLHIPFSVAYGTDKELVTKAAIEAASKVPCSIQNHSYLDNPKVWFVKFGPSSLDFELIVWYNVYSSGHRGSVKSSFQWELESALAEHKINIPFPQQDIYIKSMPKMSDPTGSPEQTHQQ